MAERDDIIAAMLAQQGQLERNPAEPPEAWNRGVRHVVSGLAEIPKKAIQQAQNYTETGEYNPAPIMEAAQLVAGGGIPFAAKGAVGAAGGRLVQPRRETMAGFAPDKSVVGDLFDYSKIRDIPDVKQFDLPRYAPKHGVSERVESLIGNKKVQQQMMEKIEQGKGMNAQTFYYNEPLRQAFVDELGKKKGQQGFARYMDYVAGTSPRSDVETNARNASYYYWLEKQGLPVPAKGGVNPQPYGHMAQNLHRENASKIRSGEYFDYINNPKPLSFSQNLQGNFAPVTVDAHAFKLPAMLKRDPDFLAGSLKLEKGAPTINPTKMYEKGDLTMREAAQRPVYWASKPNPNEYAAMEQYYKMLSREAKLAPGQGQAAAWAGGGNVTGLGSVAGDPFMRAVENRAIKTAAERGLTPQEALSQMMRGKAPLLTQGGLPVGGLAERDQYGR